MPTVYQAQQAPDYHRKLNKQHIYSFLLRSSGLSIKWHLRSQIKTLKSKLFLQF